MDTQQEQQITLKEILEKSPSLDRAEKFIFQNKWIIHNFKRERLIAEKLQEYQLFSARAAERCADAGKAPQDFPPLSVPSMVEVPWYKTKIFGYSVSLTVGIGIGYLLFH